MSTPERIALLVGSGLAAAALSGLLWRGHWRSTWVLNVYLPTVVANNLLLGLWPDRSFHFWYWLSTEAVFGIMGLGLAAELAYRIFGKLPRARNRVGGGLLAIIVALGWAAFPLPSSPGDLVAVVLPRIAYTRAAAFAWLAGCVIWYNLPLHPIHRAILAGLTPYLVLFSASAHLLHEIGWQAAGVASTANVLAFLALLAYWARVAWARHESDMTPALLFLQPWRAR